MSARAVTVLHVTTVPSTLRFLEGHVAYMRARGLRIAAASSPGPELDDFARRHGAETFAVEMPRAITPARDARAVARLVRVVRRLRPDIVHAHTPKGGLIGMVSARLAGAPVRIYHMRGLPHVAASGARRALLAGAERVSCGVAHRVFAVSHSIRDIAIADGLCPPDRIRVLAGGSGQGVDALGAFDPARLAHERAPLRRERGIPADAIVFAFVGRVVRDKGIGELAAAWRTVRERRPDAHLVVIGPREPQDPVPGAALRSLEQDARVHMVGPDWQVARWFVAADVAVLPTYREGFPNVLLEAGAMGLPVVATRVPGCVDAVEDGRTGTLVPARDADALTDAMLRYASDPALRRAHGQAARERVLRDFLPERIQEAMYAEYVTLLERAGIRAASAPVAA